jgi:YD repeat-containing protein
LGYDTSSPSRLTSIQDPSPDGVATGPTMTFAYDGSDRITTFKDPRNHPTTFAYNGNGRVTTINRPDGVNESLYGMQMEGLALPGTGLTSGTAVTAVMSVEVFGIYTDGNNNSWNTRYDWLGFGVPNERIDPLSNEQELYRDANGLAWLTADRLGQRSRYYFDSLGNPTLVSPPDDSVKQQYTYNEMSQPLTFKDENSKVTTFVRDLHGNLTSLVQPTVGAT